MANETPKISNLEKVIISLTGISGSVAVAALAIVIYGGITDNKYLFDAGNAIGLGAVASGATGSIGGAYYVIRSRKKNNLSN